MSAEDIELAIDYPGEPGGFVSALSEVGFIDGEAGKWVVHDWAEHNPWAAGASARSAKARWNAVKRHHGVDQADKMVPEYAAIRPHDAPSHQNETKRNAQESDASSINTANNNKATRIAPYPSPYPSSYPSIKHNTSRGSVAHHDEGAPTSEPEKPKAKRANNPAPEKPDDVTDQTWADWLQLRKTKKAPVTETVLKQARSESQKAGIGLEAFLQIWCARGSTGLQADWLKPSELATKVRRAPGKPSINDFSEGGDDDPFSTMRRTL